MALLAESRWYWLSIFILLSLIFVPLVLAGGARIIYIGYKGAVAHFSEAWKDFTLEVETNEVAADDSSEV
jgi:hypothetical protein